MPAYTTDSPQGKPRELVWLTRAVFLLYAKLRKQRFQECQHPCENRLLVMVAVEEKVVERDSKDPAIRTVHHVKSSAAPSGPDFTFEIRPDSGFKWLSFEKTGAPVKTVIAEEPALELPKNKHELATMLLNKALKDGPVPSTQIKKMMEGYRIGDKTMNEVKAVMGIKPYRKMRVWYWALPERK